MTEIDILNNKLEIVDCAKFFRHDANYFMNELTKDFNFSLASDELFPKEIYSHKYNNKGVFRDEWIYFFHGAECRFENSKTGQIIELIYITKPEFGFLDALFFYNYMSTTERFKNLSNWFEDFTNVSTAINLLADKGILTRFSMLSIKRNIIAF